MVKLMRQSVTPKIGNISLIQVLLATAYTKLPPKFNYFLCLFFSPFYHCLDKILIAPSIFELFIDSSFTNRIIFIMILINIASHWFYAY